MFTSGAVVLCVFFYIYRSEASQYKHFIELHDSLSDGASMHAIPTLLPGDLVSGAEFIRHGEFTPLAIKKYTSFRQYASLWPEFSHVFIGDNGQVRGSLLFTLK